MWELQTNMKIANWHENCKLIWEWQSNYHVLVYSSYVDVCNFHMRHSRNENLFWKRMFWLDCGVDDKNSTKQALAKPFMIHILIPIPMLTQSDSYFKPWFLCSLYHGGLPLIDNRQHQSIPTTHPVYTHTRLSLWCRGDLPLFNLTEYLLRNKFLYQAALASVSNPLTYSIDHYWLHSHLHIGRAPLLICCLILNAWITSGSAEAIEICWVILLGEKTATALKLTRPHDDTNSVLVLWSWWSIWVFQGCSCSHCVRFIHKMVLWQFTSGQHPAPGKGSAGCWPRSDDAMEHQICDAFLYYVLQPVTGNNVPNLNTNQCYHKLICLVYLYCFAISIVGFWVC